MTDEVIATLDAGTDEIRTSSGCSGECACGGSAADGLPELDARAIPHAFRHAAILGALDGIAPGDGLMLVAPHDPLGLLAQLQSQAPDAFDVEYHQRGPEAWRLRLTRKVA